MVCCVKDALAEAGEFRHAALLREQKLAVEVEQIRHEKEAVSQVCPAGGRFCSHQTQSNIA